MLHTMRSDPCFACLACPLASALVGYVRSCTQDNVDPAFPFIVPALAAQLVASRSGAVAASSILDTLAAQTSKPQALAAAYISTLQQQKANVRIQAAVVEKLACTCADWGHAHCAAPWTGTPPLPP